MKPRRFAKETSSSMDVAVTNFPEQMYLEPVSRAKRNAEHAADKSKPNALFAPILSAIRHAVEGKSMSGVTVAQIMRSTSNGDVFVFSSKIFAIAWQPPDHLSVYHFQSSNRTRVDLARCRTQWR